jgi:hypothetical protein
MEQYKNPLLISKPYKICTWIYLFVSMAHFARKNIEAVNLSVTLKVHHVLQNNQFWFIAKNIDVERLTTRKQAPNMTAFILTSKSIGKVIPKLSASVNIS